MSHYSKDSQELIDGLREAADFLEAHPDLPVMFRFDAYGPICAEAVASDRADLGRVARILGSADKVSQDGRMRVQRRVGPVIFGAFLNDACERVVIGTKTVTKPIVKEVGVEEVEEEIVEWRCGDPILSDAA